MNKKNKKILGNGVVYIAGIIAGIGICLSYQYIEGWLLVVVVGPALSVLGSEIVESIQGDKE